MDYALLSNAVGRDANARVKGESQKLKKSKRVVNLRKEWLRLKQEEHHENALIGQFFLAIYHGSILK
jgi:hypothetical protein